MSHYTDPLWEFYKTRTGNYAVDATEVDSDMRYLLTVATDIVYPDLGRMFVVQQKSIHGLRHVIVYEKDITVEPDGAGFNFRFKVHGFPISLEVTCDFNNLPEFISTAVPGTFHIIVLSPDHASNMDLDDPPRPKLK